jgi:hypothetical protein
MLHWLRWFRKPHRQAGLKISDERLEGCKTDLSWPIGILKNRDHLVEHLLIPETGRYLTKKPNGSSVTRRLLP